MPWRPRGFRAEDLGSAQIELEVERAGLVGADGAMIQVPGGGPGHVEHELPHDLIVDPGLRAGDGAGDLLVQLLRRESLALDGRELDVTPHGWNRTGRDPGGGKLHEQVALPRSRSEERRVGKECRSRWGGDGEE